ncbi:formylglycine-generating enzyme required for sulfatase activity [Paucibacter oligotrophus]|uniref:Formylglycine-generating enzyme required for sulfatase activity n=1 Tax=Roseateles oligotrophus TaxID=1769250 RepID=A0A840L3X2_9BURK|nr:SUMF1/EgtB/PvdO family nonheme iron enzyme [Roseateles oligotrophus]MBB4843214.1 formylglycine-generating enzyme required for sulfatase activity [Roseateles oligotrophus]
MNPNDLPVREAMGLPAGFVDRLGLDVFVRHHHLFSRSTDELIALLEDPAEPFVRRYAAGHALALLGDPRIRVDEPEMVRLPEATATMGTQEEAVAGVVARWAKVHVKQEWIEKECPAHTVQLKPFALGRYPVTNLEYRCYLEDAQSSELPTSWRFGIYPAHLANHPVWTVPPEAADHYAQWLSRRTGRQYRLATEAEWEYAASGGDGREYPWGSDFDSARANTVEAGPLGTTPVGMYPGGRSPFGLDDIAGNVEEFTASPYAPYPGGRLIEDDLHQAAGSTYRISRGGSFSRFGDLTRCSRRHGLYAAEIYAIGFRLAMDIV